MKQGRDLTQLAQEITRQQNTKADYIADTREIGFTANDGGSLLTLNGHGDFAVTPHTHAQIRERLDIPAKYYDRLLREAPGLLSANVNYWFSNKPERRMIRTLDGNARAFLSGRYRPLDNYDLIEAVLPAILNADCQVASCEVTESRLYIKAVSPRIEAEVKKGDIVQAGLIVSNSEIGLGSIKIEPLIYRLACENGMIAPDYGLQARHVGRIHGEGDGVRELWQDSTKRLTDAAFWNQVADTVNGVMNQVKFGHIVRKLQEASESEPIKRPVQAVDLLQKKLSLSDAEKDGILAHLVSGGDLSKWGTANAITRYSQDVSSYDRATDLENAGWSVVKLSTKEWSEITSEN